MQCPYCHNEIKKIEICPECKSEMIFLPEEGPMGTWECRICSTDQNKVGYRTTPMGLERTTDLVGRYRREVAKEVKFDPVNYGIIGLSSFKNLVEKD